MFPGVGHRSGGLIAIGAPVTGAHRLHRDKLSSQPLGGSSRTTITDHQNFLRGGVPWLRGNRFLGAPFPDRVRGYSLMSLTSSIQKQLIVFPQALARLVCKAPPTRLQTSAQLSIKRRSCYAQATPFAKSKSRLSSLLWAGSRDGMRHFNQRVKRLSRIQLLRVLAGS